MTVPADKLPADALPYWRAGLRSDDAIAAAKVARKQFQTQRSRMMAAALAAGVPIGRVAAVFGVSPTTCRRLAHEHP